MIWMVNKMNEKIMSKIKEDILSLESMLNISNNSENDNENEYKRAAKYIKNYINESGILLEDENEILSVFYDAFNNRFGIDALKSLNDDNLLETLFYANTDANDNLCYWLEMQPTSKEYYGGISGGSAYKFGLFKHSKTNKWTTGSPTKPVELSEEGALALGKEIRDKLISGYEIISSSKCESLEDYINCQNKLNSVLGNNINTQWIHKYFSIMFPDKFCGFHSFDWQKHVLYSLRIKPHEDYYVRSGQIAIICRYANLKYHNFIKVIVEKFGGIRRFIKLNAMIENVDYSDEMFEMKIVGIPWKDIGNLSDYDTTGAINKKAIADSLADKYFSDNKKASKYAGEIKTFYESDENSIFVIMKDDELLAFASEIEEYQYDSRKNISHYKRCSWKTTFSKVDVLPDKNECSLTMCHELRNEANLLYLYEKYFYEGNLDEGERAEKMKDRNSFVELVYKTGISTNYQYNRILFGAPGTGKSYTINKDKDELLVNGGGFERVTFHPDYSYAGFVGTYKPVSSKGEISYKFIPGPFMRTLVKALESGRSLDPKPYLLLIEEINRANVAAVFGDVFQLLDRKDGISEYAIQASEDIKEYLAEKLGGEPDNYETIRIPDNMLIWATMNSADQGVFPMDTAFKRRWDFTYLGINDAENDIIDKVVRLPGEENSIAWNSIRKGINSKMVALKINEDKQLGPYFINVDNIIEDEETNELNADEFIRIFKNKVLMYLFEDAVKQRRSDIFGGCEDSHRQVYSEICKEFDAKGIDIFSSDITNAIEEYENQRGEK